MPPNTLGEITTPDGDRLKELEDECAELRSQLAKQQNEMGALRAIVSQVPKCWRLVDGKLVQDVPIVPSMEVWNPDWKADDRSLYSAGVLGIIVDEDQGDIVIRDAYGCEDTLYAGDVYSTREAAEKARGK